MYEKNKVLKPWQEDSSNDTSLDIKTRYKAAEVLGDPHSHQDISGKFDVLMRKHLTEAPLDIIREITENCNQRWFKSKY